MNYSELISRLTILEQKVNKLSPDYWAEVAGESVGRGVNVMGITTVERTALGVTLATSGVINYLMVYDTDDDSPYWWNGTEWV